MKEYIFNGTVYPSILALTQVLWNKKGVLISQQITEAELKKLGVTIRVHVPTDKEVIDKFSDLVQECLDSKARDLNYDSCLSVCSYINSGSPKFDAEGEAFRKWRTACWTKCYELVAEVQEGKREIPTEEELIALLPKLTIAY